MGTDHNWVPYLAFVDARGEQVDPDSDGRWRHGNDARPSASATDEPVVHQVLHRSRFDCPQKKCAYSGLVGQVDLLRRYVAAVVLAEQRGDNLDRVTIHLDA